MIEFPQKFKFEVVDDQVFRILEQVSEHGFLMYGYMGLKDGQGVVVASRSESKDAINILGNYPLTTGKV